MLARFQPRRTALLRQLFEEVLTAVDVCGGAALLVAREVEAGGEERIPCGSTSTQRPSSFSTRKNPVAFSVRLRSPPDGQNGYCALCRVSFDQSCCNSSAVCALRFLIGKAHADDELFHLTECEQAIRPFLLAERKERSHRARLHERIERDDAVNPKSRQRLGDHGL